MTARELALRLGVSARTIYRDVEALCSAGVPIYTERGSSGGLVLSDEYRRALAQFTNDELQSLFASGLGPLGDLGIASPAQALQKLAGALPAAQRRAAESSRTRLFVDHNRWSRGAQPTDLLKRLRAAAEADRCVRLQYRDRGGSLSERDIDPLGLVAKAGIWYLVAREQEKGYRTFRAQRIADIEELEARFERPTDFDLEAYWNASVRTIEEQPQETYEVVLRTNRERVVRFTAFWDAAVLHEDETSATLRIAFPSWETAVAHLLVAADIVDIVSPGDLPQRIVERANAALRAFAPAQRSVWV